MKLFFVFALILWLICGAAGAAWKSGLGNMHFKDIAKGPITLVHAINDNPIDWSVPSN